MYQKITIIGNLGRDPEMRFLPSGQAVTNISVASNRSYTDPQGAKQKETTWWRVSVWGAQAESVNQYLKQGSRCLVEGRMRPDPETGNPRIWTRNDGTPGANFEITAQRVVFLSSVSESQGSGQEQYVPAPEMNDDDDIPF